MLIVWPGLKSLLGPAVLCKLKSAWPEGQQPSSSNDWPSQPTALEKLVYCKNIFAQTQRERAIPDLITPIWLQKQRSGPFTRKQSKQARDNCTFLFPKISPDILWESHVAEIRRHARELCAYTCYTNRDSRKSEHGSPLYEYLTQIASTRPTCRRLLTTNAFSLACGKTVVSLCHRGLCAL